MNKLLALILLPSFVGAWDKLPGYPETILAKTGSQIETTGSFKRNIEIAYLERQKLFAISFYNYKDKGDQVLIPDASFQIRGCDMSAKGVIQDYSVLGSKRDSNNMKKLLDKCNEVYIRVYDNRQNYATYVVTK